ncbi:MAG: prepilin-type N-terminal cleavage/methylation domain-containing protein [Acidobacteria bacterium]|nr:prepilin-type N-terminal cleavage/methylation domain-containing protein [Acidobacteriota bacterium]
MSFRRLPGARPSPRPSTQQEGFTLAELLVVVTLLGLVVAWGTPTMATLWRRTALRAAAHDLAGLVRRLRHEAVAHERYEAWVFSLLGGRWQMQRIADGNRNGVRSADMRLGVDRAIGPAVDLAQRWPRVRLSLPEFPLPRIPPSRGVLEPGSDPVRLSGTDRISCAPNGSCSGGTLYLNAGGREVAAVVVYGITGRVRLWRYEPETSKWIRY